MPENAVGSAQGSSTRLKIAHRDPSSVRIIRTRSSSTEARPSTVLINTVDGLASVDEDLVRMMRTLDGSRWAIFKRVELPWALPTAFSGMRVAATYAAIGAVFGEWAGSSAGLGYL